MRSTTYEIGAKGGIASLAALGQVRYDAALYWFEVRNDLVPFDGGAYFFTAGRSRRKGLELGLDWLPVAGMLLEGAVTVADNRYLQYRNLTDDFAGHRIAGLPRTSLSGRARYRGPAGFSTELRVESTGAYYADDANTARAAAYTVLGATLAYARTAGEASLRAFFAGENLTDRHYVSSVFINGVNDQYFEPGMPRNWSAGLTLRFR